jgi:hypothetical protein
MSGVGSPNMSRAAEASIGAWDPMRTETRILVYNFLALRTDIGVRFAQRQTP